MKIGIDWKVIVRTAMIATIVVACMEVWNCRHLMEPMLPLEPYEYNSTLDYVIGILSLSVLSLFFNAGVNFRGSPLSMMYLVPAFMLTYGAGYGTTLRLTILCVVGLIFGGILWSLHYLATWKEVHRDGSSLEE